ncbi:MAG TPA: MOFRL family protein, partial [Pirellulales bacterium]
QQLVLAALEVLATSGGEDIVLLSGGTDGEDGPTDAAGAWVDAEVIRAARARQLDPHDYLLRNDAYSLFDALGSLLKTGPTHTNVCDLRVVLVNRPQAE